MRMLRCDGSSIGRTLGCGPGGCEFDPRPSPLSFLWDRLTCRTWGFDLHNVGSNPTPRTNEKPRTQCATWPGLVVRVTLLGFLSRCATHFSVWLN